MFVYFGFENAKLREAVKEEQALYEEAVQLIAREEEEYESLWSKLKKALEANKELDGLLVNISGKVLVPLNYTLILERG
jgi:hypothetical protein